MKIMPSMFPCKNCITLIMCMNKLNSMVKYNSFYINYYNLSKTCILLYEYLVIRKYKVGNQINILDVDGQKFMTGSNRRFLKTKNYFESKIKG